MITTARDAQDEIQTRYVVAWQNYQDCVTIPNPDGTYSVSCVPAVPQSQVARLNADGALIWRNAPFEGSWLSVALLDDGSIVVASSHYFDDWAKNDIVLRFYDAAGAASAPDWRTSIPREADQIFPSAAVVDGRYVAVASNSEVRLGPAELSGQVDLVQVDATGAAIAADPPVVSNNEFGSLEWMRNLGTIAAGNDTNRLAVLYSSDKDEYLDIGTKVKAVILAGGPPICPADVECQTLGQDDLIAFFRSKQAAYALNVVIRPGGYEGDRVAFLRDLRDVFLTGIVFGARQHRRYYTHFNLFAQDHHTLIPAVAPDYAMREVPIFTSDEDRKTFEIGFPWVRALGGQMRRTEYENWVEWYTDPDRLSGGGALFMFPAGAWVGSGTFAHELSHALYWVADHYVPTWYVPPGPENPGPAYWGTEEECRADATGEGWPADDCYLRCKVDDDRRCVQDWWSAEPRHSGIFDTMPECEEWRNSHELEDVGCDRIPAWPYAGKYRVYGLRDVMGEGIGPEAMCLPGNCQEMAAETEVYARWPTESFQRACERGPMEMGADLLGRRVRTAIPPC